MFAKVLLLLVAAVANLDAVSELCVTEYAGIIGNGKSKVLTPIIIPPSSRGFNYYIPNTVKNCQMTGIKATACIVNELFPPLNLNIHFEHKEIQQSWNQEGPIVNPVPVELRVVLYCDGNVSDSPTAKRHPKKKDKKQSS